MKTCDHVDDTCLCDVLLEAERPIAYINFARDSYYSRKIVEHLGLSTPFSDADILKFFEMQCRIKDALDASAVQPRTHFADGRVNPKVASARVTTVVRDFIAMMVRAGETTSEIRRKVAEQFGIELSSHYASVLRRRVVAQ